jgi:hypothetical protein
MGRMSLGRRDLLNSRNLLESPSSVVLRVEGSFLDCRNRNYKTIQVFDRCLDHVPTQSGAQKFARSGQLVGFGLRTHSFYGLLL